MEYVFITGSTGMTEGSSPGSWVVRVRLNLTRMYDGMKSSWCVLPLDVMGGSSGCRKISTMTPRAPFVMSRSVSTFCVTITFMPTESSTTSGRSRLMRRLRCSPPPPRFANAYRSSRVNGCPFTESTAEHTKIFPPDIRACFRCAASFHCRRTACRGVTRHASAQGLCAKSGVGAVRFVRTS